MPRVSNSNGLAGAPTRHARPVVIAAVVMWMVIVGSGCRLFNAEELNASRSPLHPPSQSADSVTLEIYWARLPATDTDLAEGTWDRIDENQLPPNLRGELLANGFRAGVVGSALPEAIAELLEVDDDSVNDTDTQDRQEGGGLEQRVDLLAEPKVRSRLLQLKHGRRAEIQASDIYSQAPVLLARSGELSGRTYHDAQAVYAIGVQPEADRSVRLRLTPELHHGPTRLSWTGSDNGVLRHAPLRDHEVFAQLQTSVRLAPGEMLLLAGRPDAEGSLGHYFHTADSDGGHQQKVVLVRLAEVPPSATFSDDGLWPWR